MFAKLFAAALIATLATVRADPNPTSPGPGDIFNQGSDCKIVWDADTTGVWKVMYIELMSGSNLAMNHITTVAQVDGTDPNNNTLSYPCPEVTPNAPIYFYQFTSPASKTPYWTTRFTIADANGHADPAANATQPGGDPIPWGVGALTDPSKATPPPPAPGSDLSSASNSTSTPASSVPTTPTPTPAAQQSNSSSSSNTTNSTSSASSASASPSSAGATKHSDAGSLHIPIIASGALAVLGFAMSL